MTEPRSTAAGSTVDRRRLALALAGASLAALALALWGGRKVIAREALLAWLRANGVTAQAEVAGFGPGDFSGRVTIGDPRAPDFAVEHASVAYGLTASGFEVRSIRLTRPVLRANLRDGKFSMGSLDPLIEEFRRRPPRPDRRQPRIDIDHGLVLLGADAGLMRIDASAALDDGKLLSLDAGIAPTRLRKSGYDVRLGRSTLRLRTTGDRVAVTFDGQAGKIAGAAVSAEQARLRLTAHGPYPDLKKRRGDGAVSARAELTAARLQSGAQALEDATLSSAFQGQATGWIDTLAVGGAGQADLRASGGQAGQTRFGVLRASTEAGDLRWSRKGGDAVTATPKVTALVQDLAAGGLSMGQVTTALAGPAGWDRTGARYDLSGGLGGRGAWTGFGAPLAADTADMAAVKRAARGFTVAAPALRLASGKAGPNLLLLEPARLKPAGGGEARISPSGAGVLWGPGGGAFRLAVAGGGLPRVAAEVDGLRPTAGGVRAAAKVRARLSIGPMLGADVDAAGRLEIADGFTSFTGGRCATVRVERLELGVNDVAKASGRFCPTDVPLLTLGAGAWRLRGRAEGVAADLPSFQAHVAQAAGPVDFGARGETLHADAPAMSGVLSDAAPRTRFNPIRVKGAAKLAGGRWTARIDARTPGGAPLGHAVLRHEMASGRGGLDFDTGQLQFAEGGLQPAQLSPMAAAIGSPAEGRARFQGDLAWAGDAATSRGVLDVPDLDFLSPAGRVSGLSGRVVFTSLAPLVTAPGQILKADSVAAAAPLTGVSAALAIDAKALTITGGQAALGGGTVRLERFSLPLAPGAVSTGVVDLENVQLHDIVEASPFGPRMELDARVSGRAPFTLQDGKVRITGGELRAIAPGRLTIDRAAFTAPDAQGTVESSTTPAQPAPEAAGPFTDFAYQAMEDLAFEILDARIDSQPDGRMGVLFHIVGRHDPPQKQQIRLSVFDLIGRKFMNRPLPLPSGTKVDLTLDTTLNLDDLLADYAEYQRLRNSRGVQP